MIEELPPGWTTGTIQELAGDGGLMTDGDWIESKDQDPSGGVRLIQLADVGDGEFLDRSSRFLNDATASRLRCTFLKPGDVLVARMPDPLGRACVFPGVEMPAVTAVDVCIWRPGKRAADPRWLMHIINSPPVRGELANLASGTTRQRVSGGNLKRFSLPVPPLAEQRRIVARIEALFARTRQARADLLRIAPLAERHMSAALAATFRGELLTPPLGDAMPPPLVPLTTVVETLRYGTAQKCSTEPRGVAVLRIPNVANGRIDLGDLKYGELDRAELERLRLRVGDILIIRSNGSPTLVGRPALVGPEAEGLAFAGYLIRARPRSDRVVPAFLSLMLQAPQIREHIEINARSSSGVHNINSEELGALEVPLPPIEQQRQIVERLSSERGQAVRLAHEGTRALALLDNLERSILTRAFRGELVTQDPADEPASAFFERSGSAENSASSELGTKRRGRRPNPKATNNETKESGMGKTRADVTPEHLRETLKALGGKAKARDLWRQSGMDLDEFYKLLRDEVKAGHVVEGKDKDDLVLAHAA